MGLFARFTCLRHDGTSKDLAQTVRDLLQSRNVVETPDPAAAERLLMIAPAGDGWLMVFDHVEDPSAAMADADGLLDELGRTSGALGLDIVVADSGDLVFLLIEGGRLQAQLAVDGRGPHGPLEPWRRLLMPGQAVEDIRKAFAQPTTLIEEHFPALKPLFGIDLAAFHEIGRLMSAQTVREDAVVLRSKHGGRWSIRTACSPSLPQRGRSTRAPSSGRPTWRSRSSSNWAESDNPSGTV